VLIDGRPTLLEPSDALRQMPSGSLDRIEIITNPSAKYDAEGVSGIVNLVTKRRRGSGLSGVANGNSGIWGSYGGDFTLNWASGIVSAFAGADYTGRPTPGALAAQQWSAVGNDTLRVSTTGSSTRNRRLAGAHAGVDLNWAKTDRSSFTIFYGSTRMGFDQNGTTLQSRNSSSDTVHYQSINDVAQGGEYVSAAIEQHHGFGAASDTGHSLNVRAELQRRGHSGSATAELFQGGQVATGWRSTQSGPAFRWLLNADYALPVRKTGRFEAGYQSSFGRPTFDNGVYQYDTIADSFVRVSEYSSTTSLAYDVHALYSTWTGSWQRFEYMAGVRGEYSSQRIKDSSMDSTLLVTTEGLFPSARISYRPASDLVLQTSYARRTSRPVGRDFIPALTWQDAYNVVLGNPELRPEYIDSWEAEANSPLGGGQVAATAYCRRTQDKVDEVRSTFTEGVLLHESWNVGNDRALGGEFSFDFAPVRWWTLSPSADLYDYRIAGTVADMEFDRSSLNWTARLGNEFRLPTSTKLQLNVSYESPSVSAQGRKEGALTADLGVRQLLFKHLAIVLQARDLFGTSRENLTSEGAGFYTQSTYRPRAPVIGLSLNWNFNNFRPTSRMRDTGREES